MKTIKQLAEDAGLNDIFRDGSRWQSHDGPSVSREDLAKFAALVAERCAAALQRIQLGTKADGYDYFNAIESAKAVILAEFPKP